MAVLLNRKNRNNKTCLDSLMTKQLRRASQKQIAHPNGKQNIVSLQLKKPHLEGYGIKQVKNNSKPIFHSNTMKYK